MQLAVARVGKPHGLRGEVTVQVHTDDPGRRFVPGTRFVGDPPAGPLTLVSVRRHRGALLLGFEGHHDRAAAEALRGTVLLLDVADESGQDSWHATELVGLRAASVSGELIGEIVGLETGPAQDRLVLRLADGREALVPFVRALVPEVDIVAGQVLLDLPDGLLELSTVPVAEAPGRSSAPKDPRAP